MFLIIYLVNWFTMESESIEQMVSDIQKRNKNKDLIKSNKREVDSVEERNDKRILERHSYLYKELQHCKDIETYNKIWKEFAELDVKVARIKNNDVASRLRCEMENQYKFVQ